MPVAPEFTFTARVDGTDISPIVLAGASIEYGRVSLLEQPNVPVAVLEILTEDAYPPSKTLYPEFGLGDWATGLSGFVDTYADAYTGVTSRLTIGVPVEIDVSTSAGMSDTYTDEYEGFLSRRFTGRAQAFDYTPGSIQLTCTPRSEEWARIDVGGTGIDVTIPVEYESERATRYAAEAGITLIVDGPPSVLVVSVPAETAPQPLMALLVVLMAGTGGAVYTDRSGFVHVQTRDYVQATPDTVYLPPETTLLDPVRMSLDLGYVRNRVSVEYGPVATAAGGQVRSDSWTYRNGTGAPGNTGWNRTDDGSPATGEPITLRISHYSSTNQAYEFTNVTTAMRLNIAGNSAGDRWAMDIDSVAHTVPGPNGYTTFGCVLTSVNGTINNNEPCSIAIYSPDVKSRPVYTVEDPDQIAQYGIRDYTESTPIEVGGDASVYAQDRLALLSPHWQMPDAAIALYLADVATVTALCGIEQGTPVIVPQLLPGSPMHDYPGTVLGYSETLSRAEWTLALHMTRRDGGTVYSPELVYPASSTYEGKP